VQAGWVPEHPPPPPPPLQLAAAQAHVPPEQVAVCPAGQLAGGVLVHAEQLST